MAKFDVGIYGLWYGNNYGSIITYYALSKVVESMGLSYAMVRNPLGRKVDIDSLERSHPLRFAKEKYRITKLRPLSRLNELNDLFDTFIIGSDQMWNYHLSRPYQQSYFLDFAGDDKRKITYAVSFGKDSYIGPDDEKEKTKRNLDRFNAISVRDDFSKRICEKDFNVKAELVLDPVFLCGNEVYEQLIEESELRVGHEFMLAYILDPNPSIGRCLEQIASETSRKIIVVFNQTGDYDELKNRLDVKSDMIEFQLNITVQEWLYLFRNAEYVFTDSFHGTCFSIIFRKPFVSLKNNGRGGSRFPFLLDSFGLIDRMIESPDDFAEKFRRLSGEAGIDYGRVGKIMSAERERCRKWLADAISNAKSESVVLEPKKPAAPPKKRVFDMDDDTQKCRYVAALLKKYNIRHIVASSGLRHVGLVRFLENNDCFTVHPVVDERSAGFFAIGVSTRLNEPVACVCTSGTASSNYLTSASEAFYQHVPIIYITADRYPELLNQREDQMVPQDNMFGSVMLRSVSLPNKWDDMSKDVTRRLVCEAIIEATRGVRGPVHINVPIRSFSREPLPLEAYDLGKFNLPRIQLHNLTDGDAGWKEPVNRLKKSRVLIYYGQNRPLSAEEMRAVEDFAAKVDCVFLTEHISNFRCSKSVASYNLLKTKNMKTLSDEVIKALSADVVITMFGSKVECHVPKEFKYHWEVNPSGRIADPYRKLTRVFECEPVQFFRRIADMLGDVKGGDEFYKT